MKKAIALITLCALLLFAFCSCFNSDDTEDQGSGSATSDSALGDYGVTIESCRLSSDYSGKPIVIVKFKFTNNGDEPACFLYSLDDKAFQNGVGLNKCYVAKDSANYSSDNQTKELKKGSSLFVEVAYVLNDTTTDVQVEVSEYLSLDDKKVTKRFSIN